MGFRLKVKWLWFTKCREFTIGDKTDRGTYPVIFCDKWRWHKGNHYDKSEGVNWYDQRVTGDG